MARINIPFTQHSDDSGNPLIGGLLHFFEVGTATKKDTFADANLTKPNSNPVVLSGSGREPNIYGLGTYRVTLSDSEGSTIEVRDNVGSDTSEGYGSDWDSTVTYDLHNVVLHSGDYFESIISSNTGNTPGAGGAWGVLGKGYGTDWDSTVTYDLHNVVFHSGTYLESIISSNIGNTPGTGGEWGVLGNVTITAITVSDAAWVGSQHAKSRMYVAIAAGGAGGGVDGQGASTAAVGSPGAAGATSIRTESRTDFSATYNIQIGAGGAGSSAANGTSGGTTSVTSAGFTLNCTGGGGGVAMVASATIQRGIATLGGEASGGDINMGGDDAMPAVVNVGRGIVHPSGPAAYLGSVTARTFVNATSSAGTASRGFGGGGTGAACDGVSDNQPGGPGGNGVVYVWEYF